jgi:hypothetical protein
MIRITQAKLVATYVIRLEFSDGSTGDYDLSELVSRDTVMVRPLADPEFFAGFFIELGALCWPNGFELSGSSIHARLLKSGLLRQATAA